MVLVILPIVKIRAARPLIDAREIPAYPPTRYRVELGWGQPLGCKKYPRRSQVPGRRRDGWCRSLPVSDLLVYDSSGPGLVVGSWLDLVWLGCIQATTDRYAQAG